MTGQLVGQDEHIVANLNVWIIDIESGLGVGVWSFLEVPLASKVVNVTTVGNLQGE